MNDLDLFVLKILITNKKCATEFVTEVDHQVFAPEFWRFSKLVFDYIKVYKEVPTCKTLREVYASKNEKLASFIEDTFNRVSAFEADEKEYSLYVKKLKDAHAKRLLANIREKVFSQEEDEMDVQECLKTIQGGIEKVRGLYAEKVYNQKTLKGSIEEFIQRYQAKQRDPNFGRGIFTGYSFFDFVTNGLRPQELFIVGGESGSGKSMMLMNMAVQMWQQNNKITDTPETFKKGYNVIYFSLEMPHEQCMNRLVSRISGVPYRSIRDGSMTDEEKETVNQTLKFIRDYPYEFKIVDISRGATSERLELIFNDTKIHFTPDIVVVDYMGLMEYEGEMDDWLKLGKISEKLHEFARIYNVVMLTAVQLNRPPKTKGPDSGEAVSVNRIGRSALIVQNANVFLQIEKRPNEHQHPDFIVHILKNRDGELVKGKLLKNFMCCAILNDYGVEGDNKSDSDDISNQIKKLDETK